MTYIIAEPCIDIKDRSCVDVCPVDCIHEADRILVIDPEECIDCGACEPECPVEAIFPEDALPDKWNAFVEINYAYDKGFDVINQLTNAYATFAALGKKQAPTFLPSGALDTNGPGFSSVSGVALANQKFYLNGVGLAGRNGIPPGLVDNHWNTFAPRVGFAFDLTGKQKTILGMPCQQALLKKDKDTVEAWFTPAIPVSAGPMGLAGLPGMILEATQRNVSFVATAFTPGTADAALIVKPKEGKKVTGEEYDKIVEKKTKEMADEYGGNGNVIIKVNR
jgi:NAD-dependent dihydropyrimidine dehydrogenase PreA subunit